jgi:Protein of unknown function (DUF3945)
MINELTKEENKAIYDKLKSFTKNEIVDKLQRAGISNTDALDEDDFRLLKSGRNCHTLLTNKFTDNIDEQIKQACDTTQCKVKIIYLQEKQDFYVNKKYAQLTLQIPDNYLGIEITSDLKAQLEKYNNIGVQKITNKDGKESVGFVSIDKDLKTMIFVPTSNVFIPDKLGENPISERQKESLKAGYTVNYLDYKTKNSEIKKKVNLMLSPFIEGKITFSDGPKLNVAEKQEQTNDLKKTNTKSTKLA